MVSSISSNKEIKKVNKGSDQGVDFNDTFKVDNHVLSILYRANGICGVDGKKFYFKGGKFCFKYIKPQKDVT